MLENLIEICDINSGTLNVDGVERVGDILEGWFGEFVAPLQRSEIAPWETIDARGMVNRFPLGTVLHWSVRPEAEKRVILNIHRDTVYSLDHHFQTCKFVDNNTLNGPGVSDAKGGIIVMLYALRAFEKTEVAKHIGWDVIINPDEELGSPGSSEYLMNCAPNADIGLLFEPAYPDGTMVTWRKGSGNFILVVKGRSAHAGREFDSGRNAIVAMCDAMQQIHQLNGTKDDVTLNVGRVEGGGALNVVPDLAIGRVNARVKTVEQSEWVLNELQKISSSLSERDGISCQLHGSFTSPPKTLDQKTQQLQEHIEACGKMLDMEIKWQGTGGASDGNKFMAAGLPNIDTLGPIGGNIHSDEEFVFVDSLVPKAKLAALVLTDFAIDPSLECK